MGSSGFFHLFTVLDGLGGDLRAAVAFKGNGAVRVTMTDTLLSFTVYPAMPSWVETRVLVGISCDTPSCR